GTGAARASSAPPFSHEHKPAHPGTLARIARIARRVFRVLWRRRWRESCRAGRSTHPSGSMTGAPGMAQARRRARIATGVVTALLILLIFIGSRGLKHFDSALIGYAVASVFAI